MPKELTQILFDFSASEDDKPKEFLSGKPVDVLPKKTKSTRGRKPQKEYDDEVERVNVPSDDVLFQKQYYTIGETAEMFGVNVSLLRYWEGEFGMKLRKNKKGDRFFRPLDIKQIALIHDLLRRRKFTIEGAKEFIRKSGQADEQYALIQSLQKIRGFLLELKAHL